MGTEGIHHIGFAVANLDLTTAFFTDCLGWKMVREVPDYPAKFVTDGTAFITLWQADAGAAAFDRHSNVGLHHVALKVSDKPQLDTLFDKVKDYPGVTVEFAPQPVRGGPAQHCMFYEPSGLRVEFFWQP